jgi:hypothetical protein
VLGKVRLDKLSAQTADRSILTTMPTNARCRRPSPPGRPGPPRRSALPAGHTSSGCWRTLVRVYSPVNRARSSRHTYSVPSFGAHGFRLLRGSGTAQVASDREPWHAHGPSSSPSGRPVVPLAVLEGSGRASSRRTVRSTSPPSADADGACIGLPRAALCSCLLKVCGRRWPLSPLCVADGRASPCCNSRDSPAAATGTAGLPCVAPALAMSTASGSPLGTRT